MQQIRHTSASLERSALCSWFVRCLRLTMPVSRWRMNSSVRTACKELMQMDWKVTNNETKSTRDDKTW